MTPAHSEEPYAWCRVEGFPTIKAWVGGKLVDYQGDRSAGNLKNWALSLLPNKVSLALSIHQCCVAWHPQPDSKRGYAWTGARHVLADVQETWFTVVFDHHMKQCRTTQQKSVNSFLVLISNAILYAPGP